MRKWYAVYNACTHMNFPFDDQNRDNTILGVTNNILERHSCSIGMLEMKKKGGSGQGKKHKQHSLEKPTPSND